MSLEINLVNLGLYPNDGSGDDLRTAFEKSNANFKLLGETVVLSAANLGSGAPVWADLFENKFRFRSIKRSDTQNPKEKISISFDSEHLIFSAIAIDRLLEDTAPQLGGNLDLNNFRVIGVGDISIQGAISATSVSSSSGFVGNLIGQVSDLSNHNLENLGNVIVETPVIGQTLTWNGFYWTAENSVKRIIAGDNITISPANGVGEVTVNSTSSGGTGLPEGFDFGGIYASNMFELLVQSTPVDFGNIVTPSSLVLDLGFINAEPPIEEITYQLSSSSLTVIEGSSVTITLSTTGIADGTLVPYTISGVTSEDINNTSLTGSFIVLDNTSSVTIPITLDLQSEAETFTLTLLGITPAISISVIIEDFQLPATVDGGNPETSVFDFLLDGGAPSTLEFDLEIDGGITGIPGLFPAIVDGGSPFDDPDALVDGELPWTIVTAVLDGGSV